MTDKDPTNNSSSSKFLTISVNSTKAHLIKTCKPITSINSSSPCSKSNHQATIKKSISKSSQGSNTLLIKEWRVRLLAAVWTNRPPLLLRRRDVAKVANISVDIHNQTKVPPVHHHQVSRLSPVSHRENVVSENQKVINPWSTIKSLKLLKMRVLRQLCAKINFYLSNSRYKTDRTRISKRFSNNLGRQMTLANF